MSLEAALEPKLAEIDRVARQRYESDLDSRGFVLVPGTDQLGLGGTPALWNPRNPKPGPDGEDLALEQTRYNDFLQQLAELKARFRTFYDLGDPLDFTTMENKLGANKVTAFPSGSGAIREGSPPPGYAPPPPGQLPQPPPRYVPPTPGYTPPAPPTVQEQLHSAYADNIQYVDGLITERQWTGPAAKSFQTEFLGEFYQALLWQFGYVRELAIAVRTFQGGITSANEDVKAIADMCLAAMSPEDLWTLFSTGPLRELGVVSLITAAIAFYPPLAIPAGAISLGTGLVSFIAVAANAEETHCAVTINANPLDIPAVLAATWDALTTLEGCLSSADGHLASGLGKDYVDPNAFASPYLTLPRPDLADLANEPAPLERLLVHEDGVVVELRELYRAGYANLPGAAELYGEAAALLNECSIPKTLKAFFPRSMPIFNECRDLLAQILQHISGSLSDAGQALVNTALNYQLTDAQNAQLLEAIGEIDPWDTQPQS